MIDEDLAHDRPMQRLLMGEVGSGKTVVALYAMLRAVESGAPGGADGADRDARRAALRDAPEADAGRARAGRAADRLDAAAAAATTSSASWRAGELKLLVGTHALIEEAVEFDRLAVAVVDEQHRFGVNQRRALDRKAPAGLAPHILHMTATPIPRTLALTAYGDLDVTVLRELPAGRRPIDTYVAATDAERARAYERIREELDEGPPGVRRLPAGRGVRGAAGARRHRRVRAAASGGELKDFRVVLMHGQMRPREKQEAMAAFAAGGADVLVATTVIEVGIDVPNATVMLVEDAERYGISPAAPAARPDRPRRARVGLPALRPEGLAPAAGDARAHATASGSPRSTSSCAARGRCSACASPGMQAFKFARLPEDVELLERARRHAREILDADPDLARARARPDRGRDRPRLRPGRARADSCLTDRCQSDSSFQIKSNCQKVATVMQRKWLALGALALGLFVVGLDLDGPRTSRCPRWRPTSTRRPASCSGSPTPTSSCWRRTLLPGRPARRPLRPQAHAADRADRCSASRRSAARSPTRRAS